MTDPNFLHAGDHVHLGPGVTAQRRTNPAVDLEDLPSLDGILLSHYHADHFDQHVEEALDKNFLIITTPHAKDCLISKEDPFHNVHALDHWDQVTLKLEASGRSEDKALPHIQVTGMPGKHVPPGPLAVVNDLLGAVPPTNGWMIEMGYHKEGASATNIKATDAETEPLSVGYRIYISGDTLFVDDLKKIPEWLGEKKIDLMIVHLGGTTIPGPSAPLIMVTMDAAQGIRLMRLMDPEITVPVHFDDYDVFLSPLEDFKKEVQAAGKENNVVFLNRGEKYSFTVRD